MIFESNLKKKEITLIDKEGNEYMLRELGKLSYGKNYGIFRNGNLVFSFGGEFTHKQIIRILRRFGYFLKEERNDNKSAY